MIRMEMIYDCTNSVRIELIEHSATSRYSLFKVNNKNLVGIMRAVKSTTVKWILGSFFALIALILLVYLCLFRNYEIIGESIDCSTNAPFAFNYSCGLEQYDNDTQYWTFDWTIPDGIVINSLMVRVGNLNECHIYLKHEHECQSMQFVSFHNFCVLQIRFRHAWLHIARHPMATMKTHFWEAQHSMCAKQSIVTFQGFSWHCMCPT